MISRASSRIVVAGLLVALLEGETAFGQSEEAKNAARALQKDASTRLQQRDYTEALDKLQRAYALYPSPKLYFNMGLALRGLRRTPEAAAAFQKFLREAVDAAAEPRAQARELLDELRPRVGWLDIKSDAAGAQVSIDGAPVGQTPLVDPVPVSPGRHEVKVVMNARKHEETVDLAAGKEHRIYARVGEPDLVDAAVVPPPPPGALEGQLEAASASPPPRLYERWGFWAAVGAVAIGGLVAALVIKRPASDPVGSLGYEDVR